MHYHYSLLGFILLFIGMTVGMPISDAFAQRTSGGGSRSLSSVFTSRSTPRRTATTRSSGSVIKHQNHRTAEDRNGIDHAQTMEPSRAKWKSCYVD